MLVFAAIAAWWVQGVAADWWAGVTGKKLPSQRYREARAQERAAAYKAAGRKPPAVSGAREYAAAMWALAWTRAEQRSTDWVERRRQARDPHRPRPARDYLRTVWDTGPRRRYRDAFAAAAERRRRKIVDAEDAGIDAALPDPDAPPTPPPQPPPRPDPAPHDAEPPVTEPHDTRSPDTGSAEATAHEPGPAEPASTPDSPPQPCPGCEGWGVHPPDETAMAAWSKAFGEAIDGALAGDREAFRRAEALSAVKPQPRPCPDCRGTGITPHLAKVLPLPTNQRPEGDSANEPDPAPNQETENQNRGEAMSDNETNSAEFVGLLPTMQWAQANATAVREGVTTIERAQAGIQASETEGAALELCARAQELQVQLAETYDRLARELERQMTVKEAYDTTPEAGTKSWLKAGE